MTSSKNWKKIIPLMVIIGVFSSAFSFIPAEHAAWVDWAAMIGFIIFAALSIWTLALVGGLVGKKTQHDLSHPQIHTGSGPTPNLTQNNKK